jgi:hypothetical protein
MSWTAITAGLPMLLALALFGTFAALYMTDQDAYIAAIRHWMPYVGSAPFGDTTFLTTQLECWRQGVDVYTVNPCDGGGRLMVYSPLWLRLWFLPGHPSATNPLAITLILSFILSLWVLPRVQGKTSLILLLLAIASPATAYAAERGNVDLLIFILAALAVLCAERSLRVRALGHALLLFAGLLKFYPLTTLVLILRERPRTATILECAVLAVIGVFVWGWHDELARMLPNIPRPQYSQDGVGARRLAEALVVGVVKMSGLVKGIGPFAYDFPSRPRLVAGVMVVLLVGALAFAHAMQRTPRFEQALRALSEREMLCLTVGGALYCGCFVAGTSIVYREVLLLFAIPALSRFLRAEELGWPVRASIWIPVGLMWSVTIMDLVNRCFGEMSGDDWPAATFGFWMLYETAAWWIFIVLLAALLCFAHLSRTATGANLPASGSVGT